MYLLPVTVQITYDFLEVLYNDGGGTKLSLAFWGDTSCLALKCGAGHVYYGKEFLHNCH